LLGCLQIAQVFLSPPLAEDGPLILLRDLAEENQGFSPVLANP
jgi:hypothetical protein